ncbi:MAG: hypothetical protein AB7N24_21165 [Dehalococcoidia bacterium]
MQLSRNNLILIGIAGLVISLVGQGLTLGAPGIDESGAKLQEWFADNRTLAIVAFYLVGLGLTLSLTLVITLRQRLLSAEGGTGLLSNMFLISSVLWLAICGAALGAYGAMIFRSETLSAESAQTLNDMVYVTLAMAAFPTALALTAASIVILQTRTLHVGLGYLGLLTALVHLVGAAGFDTGSGLNPQVAGLPAALLFYLWAIVGGILLMRTQEEEATALSLAAAAAMGEASTLAGATGSVANAGAAEASRQST